VQLAASPYLNQSWTHALGAPHAVGVQLRMGMCGGDSPLIDV
jgi:hypothetical protein